MRVAVIKTGALGDVVRTTALLPGLRRLSSALDLTWITAPGALPLVQGLPDVTLACTINDSHDAPWRDRRYDWIISLDDGHEECQLASNLKADRLSGGYLGPDGERRYTEDVESWFGMGILRPASRGGLHEANALKKLNTKTVATLLYECLGLPMPIGRTSLPLNPSARAKARTWLESTSLQTRQPLIGMNTGAGGAGGSKAGESIKRRNLPVSCMTNSAPTSYSWAARPRSREIKQLRSSPIAPASFRVQPTSAFWNSPP